MSDWIAELKQAHEASEAKQVCMGYAYQGIRHLQRNCDMRCESHEDGSDCVGWGRYDGTALGLVWNSMPKILAILKAAEEYVADMKQFGSADIGRLVAAVEGGHSD